MSGAICLQGGAEFGPACRDMDAALVARAGGGPVVVTALAGAPGRDARTAEGNGVRHLAGLGADVAAAPDARDDLAAAVRAMDDAAMVFLPGGSPARLLQALGVPELQQALRRLLARDGVLAGASAGAMVLGSRTLLPGGRGSRPAVADGLGLVPRVVVLPHYRGDDRWWRAVPDRDGLVGLGLPECTGVVVEGDRWTPVGAGRPVLVTDDGHAELGSPISEPVGRDTAHNRRIR